MMWEFLAVAAAGAMLGVAGSGHCAFMCGPLLTLSASHARPVARARHISLYHAGRIGMYVTLGGVSGAAGVLLARLSVGRVAAYLVAITLVGHVAATWRRAPNVSTRVERALIAPIERAIGCAVQSLAAWMRRHAIAGPAASGAVTGLLPCGMLYTALIAAAGFGHADDAIVFMAAFGVGSVPALTLVAAGAGRIGRAAPRRLKQWAPVAMLLVAALLVARAEMHHGESSAGHMHLRD